MIGKNGQEIEVKFYVNNLTAIKTLLQELGACLVLSRTHEINLRFDTRDGNLNSLHQVLRLRQSDSARLTFKGPSKIQDGLVVRQEIELIVSDFYAAQQLLEVLGYQFVVCYEKFRAIYTLAGVEVMLDELPYGNFIEIEGLDAQSIRTGAENLNINWEMRIPESYLSIFERLKHTRGFTFRDLMFSHFDGMNISADDLGVYPADSS